jgi:Uma2 family endonuclease
MASTSGQDYTFTMNFVADEFFSRHRLNVDEYHRMAEVGLLAPDARVELIEGEIIDMVPIGRKLGAVTIALTRDLARVVGDRALVSCQLPVRLDRRSEPQPDFSLLADLRGFAPQ